MSNNNDITKVSLSNDGFASFFDKKEIKHLTLVYTSDSVKLALSPIGSFVYILKEEYSIEYVQEYIRKLTSVINRNNITDTDKVLFTESSIFPRASFNRYSKKARRVELTKTATKYVVKTHATIPGYRRVRTEAGGELIGNSLNQLYYQIDMAKSLEGKNVSNTMLELHKEKARNHYITNRGEGLLTKLIGELLPGGLEDKQRFELYFNSLKDLAYTEELMKGHPISCLIDDAGVNRYLDSFKPLLDEANYNLLLGAFTNGSNNITMGMKLLENMNVNKSLGYLYALFLNSFVKQEYVIRGNKTFQNVGMKNIRKTYQLELLDRVNYSPLETISAISTIYGDKLKESKDKTIFISLIEKTLRDRLKQYLGPGIFNFIEIKKTEDEST